MPFGTFLAQRRDPRPKKEPAPKPQKVVKPVKEETPVFHEISTDRLKLNILLRGRTLAAMGEFLCAMSENMNRELHRDSLTFYTTELHTIQSIVDRKKKLERFMGSFSTADWRCPEETESRAVHTFSISPSGTQDKSLDLVFHCCTYQGESPISEEQADAVWYLADGPVLDWDTAYDGYRAFLADALAAAHPGKPVCLLLSQIEKQGLFGGTGEQRFLKPPVHRKLISRCRELFSCGDGVQVALFPVQVYGGMEFTGTDENGSPILRLSENAYCQSYEPEDCQCAAMYTIEQIAAARNTEFFADSPSGGMKKVVRRQFARRKGDLAWMPDLLREGDAQ